MRRLGRATGIVVMAVVWLTGCGDDESPAFGDFASAPADPADDGSASAGAEPESDPGTDLGSGAEVADAGLVVTVAGVQYVVDTELGGYCEIDGDTETGGQISAGGFDAESGTRVELSLREQTAEWTPSGEDEFYGGLFVASSPVQWATNSTEPWPFEVANPISATLTMEDDDGQLVDVTFEIECP